MFVERRLPMTRILAIAAILTMLYPTLSYAADVSDHPVQRLAALTADFSKPKASMIPRPDVIQTACTDRNVRCTSNSECCSGSCYFAPGSAGYCE